MPDKAEFIRRVREAKPDMIGFTIRTTALHPATEMIKWLDEEMPDIPVISGGYHATLAPQEVIALPGMDAVCVGEGEYPTRDFVNSYIANGELDVNADSFWVRGPDGTVTKNKPHPYLTDLDQLPFPDLDLFDFTSLKSNRLNTAEVIVSRGCVYTCTYCANAELRNVYDDRKQYARFRSPENSIQLLEKVLEKDPDIEYFNFNDAILNMFPKWFYEFTELYKKRIHRKYTCNLRFNMLDDKMIKELAESGCHLVTIGLENGNEAYRRKYLHRVMKNEDVIRISKTMRDEGITVYTYNIVGLPYETLELTLETIKLNAQMHTDNVVVSLFYPYPATQLQQISEDAGFIDPSVAWDDPVQLRMPDYPKSDILFADYSFMTLIRRYRKLYAIKDQAAQDKAVAALDARILSKWYPRVLIGGARGVMHNTEVTAKRIAASVAPTIYKKLRNRKLKLEPAMTSGDHEN
jgi:radical SAM superfamily enzyme YgiQ (UPF0313 family)